MTKLPNVSSRLNVHPNLKDRFAAHVLEWRGTVAATHSPPGFKVEVHNRPPGQQVPACTKCPLCKTRKQVVLFRGYLPCDVLFVGEAPGPSEDHDGYPFVGPAGEKLNALLALAWQDAAPLPSSPEEEPPAFHPASAGFTNVVACMPRNPPEWEWSEDLQRNVPLSTGTIRPPTKEEAAACAPRLHELICMAAPKLIVTLGQEAKRFLPSGKPIPKRVQSKSGFSSLDPAPDAEVINLLHPSAILRMNDEPSKQLLAEKRFVLNLSDALRNL